MDRHRCWSLLLATLLMGTTGGSASASDAGFKDLASRADAIYIGEILQSRGVEDKDGLTSTRVTMEIHDPIKGSARPGERVSVVVAGGQVDGHVAKVAGSDPFFSQDKVLLFLSESPSGSFKIVDQYKGRFALTRHPETGEPMVIGFTLKDGDLKASSVQTLDDALEALDS